MICDFCFFFNTFYFKINPLSEFSDIHFNSGAVLDTLMSVGNCCNCNQLYNNCSYSQKFIAALWPQVYLRGSGTSRCCAICSQFALPRNRFHGVKESQLEITGSVVVLSPYVKYCKTSLLS